ncbi:beta-ketoacyl synthase N-terminal-like domain-containing protein [Mycobacterium avium]|uniref:thiolase family protein n=1 Tax=Mycobacterium avium TaxID=1764 RepID=UPI000C9FADEB|nr:beta-ketoacyl synthase N-terminal-like domain-containing protein [Mycobacterium avium]
MRETVIVEAVRTPVGKRNGALSGMHAADLSAIVLNELVERTGIGPELIDDVVWGCVSQVGDQSSNIGRYAVLAAGWPESIPGTTVNRACGSSQQALDFAVQAVMSGQQDVVVAGGVEVMSRVPLGAARATGTPYGPKVLARYDDFMAVELGLTPIVRYVAGAVTGADPVLMLTGPIPATEKVLKKAGVALSDVGVFEVNEAFAPVPLAWLAETGADAARTNPLGGAIALGHPLGASGAVLMTRMAHHMRDNGIRYGLQTMCEGGGTANATLVELVS